MNWKVVYTDAAFEMALDIRDRSILKAIRERIEETAKDPATIGKPLQKELKRYYSVRAYNQRYRVLYQLDKASETMTVVAIALRRADDDSDVYEQAAELKRKGKL